MTRAVHVPVRFCQAMGVVLAALFFSHGPAGAEVLDIGMDGTVTTHDRAAAFNGPLTGAVLFTYGRAGAGVPGTLVGGVKPLCRLANCDTHLKQFEKDWMVNYRERERPCDVTPTSCYDGKGRLAAPGAPSPDIGSLLAGAAQRHALDRGLLSAVAWQESRFQAGAVSRKGAVGVMQLMPETARALGVDRHDPAQNIEGGAAYLRQMLNRYGNNTALALAAYNAGPGAVDRYGAVPPFAETQAYVRGVLGSAMPSPQPAVIFTRP